MPKYNFINKLKHSIENIFLKLLPKEHVGILEGMIIGDTTYISDEVQGYFRDCGITHLLAVSGSNVAYVLLLCKFLFQKIFGRNASNSITIFFIIVFTILSGASASVVRATIMAIIIIISEFVSQKSDTCASISLSAIFILLYNPIIIYDVGFILSFGGTIGIVLLSDKINKFISEKTDKIFSFNNVILLKIKNIILETLSITLAAQTVVVPITLYFFNTFSLVSIIVNLIVVPITGTVTIIGVIMYFTGILFMPLARLLSYFAYSLISFMIIISKFFSSIPFSNLLLPTPSLLFIMTYYLFIYWLFYSCCQQNEHGNGQGVMPPLQIIIITLVGILIIFAITPLNHMKLNMVDVGQGDCVFVETPHKKTILIDTGGTEGSDYDIGENILLPYLLDRGKRKVDYVFISHMHEDHAEGLITLLDKINVSNVIINSQKSETDLYRKILDSVGRSSRIITIDEKDRIYIDGVKFEILLSKEDMENLNNTSVVMKMTYGEVSVLFTGDAEKELEECATNNVKADILKVAHHGSNTSSTEKFLDKVSPQIAIIGVGEKNKFGHPKKEVIDRLEERKIQIFRTDINGEIYMKIYKNGKIKVNTHL